MDEGEDWKLKGEIIVSEFFKSKKNSNRLLELEDLLLSSDEECVLSIFPFVHDVFSKIFSTGVLRSCDGKNADYKLWLLERYEDFISHLLSFLSHKNRKIQAAALRTLLLLMKLESESPRKDENEYSNFPFMLFKRIVSCLVSDVLNQKELIMEFKEYTKYHDIKLYLLKAVDSVLSSSEQVTECFLQNCFLILYSVKFPKKFDDVETFAYRSDSQQPFQLKEKPFKKLFSTIWNNFLNYQMSPEFLPKALSALNETVLPHLQNPCTMTDFLTNCYNKGGVLSLLALKGLYILMDKYNLEYPDFFVKLYALLEKNIINGKFSYKFFELTDLFLSSTHLPAHIVAAFAKKMSRLSLISSADNVLKILCLVSNMLVNHPSLRIMLHNMDGKECCKDPFSMDAVDPDKSNAMKSSLWEIKSLHSHVNPDVCRKAKELTAAYPKFCSAISDISSITLYDMYKKSRKRKLNDVPLALCKPSIKKKTTEVDAFCI